MRRTAAVTLVCFALARAALGQQSSPSQAPPSAAAPDTPPAAGAVKEAPPAPPPPSEPLQVRVQRLLDDFNQRHDARVLEMYSYGKASDAEPGLKQFADPRKVEVELKDEQDRQQTSQALAKEYAGEVRQVQAQEQALQEFIAKRQKTLDELNKRANSINRQDLEVAAENLSRQPGTDAEVRDIRRRLAEDEVSTKDLSSRQALTQQELASAQDEMKRLRALDQSLDQDAKSYTADAASAHENQLHLADRLEFYVVDAQAEDVLNQGEKAAQAAHHLAASPEVQDTLESLGPKVKADAKPDPTKKCTGAANDGKGCPEKTAPDPKE